MASKETSNFNKKYSIYSFLKKGDSTNDERQNGTEQASEKRPVFRPKKPSSSTKWKPPIKKSEGDNVNSSHVSTTTPQQGSNNTIVTYKQHANNTRKSVTDIESDSDRLWDSMDVDSPGYYSGSEGKCKSPVNRDRCPKSNVTATPIKNHTKTKSPHKHKLVKTPEKKDRDPLKNLKLDSSISDFLSDISEHPVLQKCAKDKGKNLSQEELEECKTMYIDILERISDAFNRIPHCIKEKFPGYDSATYSKINHLKTKLKLLIRKKVNDNISSQTTDKSSPIPNGNYSVDFVEIDESQSPLLLSDQSYIQKNNEVSSPNSTNASIRLSLNETQPDKNDSIQSTAKKSLTFDSPASCSNESIEVKEPKGLFSYKRPSMSTLDKLQNLSEKLKPVPKESPTTTSIPSSSIAFQPPGSSKDYLESLNKGSPSINEKTIIDVDELDDYDLTDVLDDDIADVIPQSSSQSTEFSSTNASTSVNDNIDINKKGIVIDDDGWPVYREEDFNDDMDVNIGDLSVQEQEQSKYEGMGDFHAGTQNDGITGEFDGLNFEHSALMMEKFREKFGLKSFRPNQLQVINATLLGHDCFVLMPTGGGKSLCYQLPAILNPGVTIVISPLKSLILDQVNKLLSLDIMAAHLSGGVSMAEGDEVYLSLAAREPPLKLLYVTPEKVSGSEKLQSALASLYARGKLARIVIDEAHCVSAWGHDFRPDYKRLSVLRVRFPAAPIMALTATAAPRVRTDILHQLKVKNCKWFLSSFNRPNLAYRILPKKPKAVNQDVVNIIREKFPRDSGIVYCLSRKECEALAADLRRSGVQAAPYHAGLPDRRREELQAGWVADKYKVICATIAFGMGVDKADVRYVIHHSMPRSVEGYYQEAGRAGRDGERATCLMYYAYRDVLRYRHLIQMERNTTREAQQVHLENLLRMVEVCESVSECRRVQVLAYLGERFSREKCASDKTTACDNCLNQQDYKPVDVTEECKMIARCIRGFGRDSYTLLQVADVLRGAATQRLAALRDCDMHAKCKSWPRGDPARLLRQLVARQVLAERIVVNNDIPSAYLMLGQNVDKLMSGNLRIVFPMRCENKTSVASVAAPSTKQADNSIGALIKNIEDRCFADLVQACSEMGAARGASLAAVLPHAALRAMAARLPERAADMLALPHVTRANYDKYGAQLLRITAAYSVEKLGVLMQYEDDLQQEMEKKREEACSDSETDWAREAQLAAAGSPARRGRGRGRGRYSRGGRKTYKGGVRKKTRRGGGAGSAKKSRGASGAARGSFLGAMPLPKPNFAALNAQMLKAKSLKF
ncbi:recQ-like DNA helicase Blm [Epargyreus clarus]|uniref:recQ-like DNA helicase Blm n=1 Tax=Epargyreus clarus TaxID=520877 RepID=UPI003C2B1B67